MTVHYVGTSLRTESCFMTLKKKPKLTLFNKKQLSALKLVPYNVGLLVLWNVKCKAKIGVSCPLTIEGQEICLKRKALSAGGR